jgi:4-hydroxy-tetrahydrodipicolinate synthase
MTSELKGIVVPNITPFKSNYELDEDALRANIRFLISHGVHGLIPCGSTGEFASLTLGERKRVVEIVIHEAGGKVSVFPATTSVRTADSVMLTKHAKEVGADGIMLAPPYYFKPSKRELTQYVSDVASVGLPILLYNIPATVKVDMEPEFIVGLANSFSNIKYVKEASGYANRTHEIIRLSNDRIAVLNGWDDLTLETFAAGAVGWVSAPGNLIPTLCVEFYEAALKNDYSLARKLYYKLLPTLVLIEQSGKFMQYVKAGVELVGLKAGPPRPPSLPLDNAELQTYRKALQELGALKPFAPTMK